MTLGLLEMCKYCKLPVIFIHIFSCILLGPLRKSTKNNTHTMSMKFVITFSLQ